MIRALAILSILALLASPASGQWPGPDGSMPCGTAPKVRSFSCTPLTTIHGWTPGRLATTLATYTIDSIDATCARAFRAVTNALFHGRWG